MYARTLYISTLYILAFLMSMRAMVTTLALRQLLLDQATRDEEAGDGIEHAVYIATTARSTIELGKIYILIDGNRSRNARESHQLGNGNLHDYYIHISQAVEIPVAASIADIVLISIAVEQCSTEELAGKVAVLFILYTGSNS